MERPRFYICFRWISLTPGAHVTKMLFPSISLLVCSWVTLYLKSVKTRIFDAVVVIDSVCEKGVLCPHPAIWLDARLPKSHVWFLSQWPVLSNTRTISPFPSSFPFPLKLDYKCLESQLRGSNPRLEAKTSVARLKSNSEGSNSNLIAQIPALRNEAQIPTLRLKS